MAMIAFGCMWSTNFAGMKLCSGVSNELARGFWASLPYLDRDLIAAILERARASHRTAGADFAGMIDTEAFRLALGRIACGYDGGQIVDD